MQKEAPTGSLLRTKMSRKYDTQMIFNLQRKIQKQTRPSRQNEFIDATDLDLRVAFIISAEFVRK